jgi:RNA polymerase sigma factor (sigma-70 family)
MKESPPALRINAKHGKRIMSTARDDLIPTRHSLLNRLKDVEDRESWQEFFDSYWKLIYGVAMKSGLTACEAEEVVQETVIAVSKQMPKFTYDPAKSFKGWLMVQTHWRIKDQLRKRVRDAGRIHSAMPGTSTTLIERMPDPNGNDLEKVWDDEWQRHILETALSRVKRKVPAKQYQIFDLCALKRLPLRKVAELTGVSLPQIYLARHRVGHRVKHEIKVLEKKLH